MMDHRELRLIQRRLNDERARIQRQVNELEREKRALFEEGARTGSINLQTAYARKIKTLDAAMAQKDRALQVIHLQSMILAQVVYARENRDPLNQGLLAQVDWATLLGDTALSVSINNTQIQQLKQVLEVLRPPAPAAPAPTPKIGREETWLVRHVPDGDGLELEDGTRVRYLGIDAPEMSGVNGKPELLAEESRELNRALVVGKRVRLERDVSDRDRYGRLLRYVYVGNTFINAEIVRAGLAMSLLIYPDERHAADFARLEETARKSKLGMWKAGYV